MKSYKFSVLLCVLLCIAGCTRKIPTEKKLCLIKQEVLLKYPDFLTESQVLQDSPLAISDRPITIFVHGTNLSPLERNFFHSAPLGLSRVRDIRSSAYLLYKTLMRLPMAAPDFCPLENFYIFTWSGQLSFDERAREGALLHEAISDLVQKYTTAGIPVPPITIITHSHGGNVTLNLVPAARKHEYTVARLILLACPVQADTEPYVHNALFERVYSFYSTIDLLQVADPQGLYKNRDKGCGNRRSLTFSGRCFEHDPQVKQVRIKYNGRSPLHVEFLLGKFWYYIPQVIAAVDSWNVFEKPDCTFLLKLKT